MTRRPAASQARKKSSKVKPESKITYRKSRLHSCRWYVATKRYRGRR